MFSVVFDTIQQFGYGNSLLLLVVIFVSTYFLKVVLKIADFFLGLLVYPIVNKWGRERMEAARRKTIDELDALDTDLAAICDGIAHWETTGNMWSESANGNSAYQSNDIVRELEQYYEPRGIFNPSSPAGNPLAAAGDIVAVRERAAEVKTLADLKDFSEHVKRIARVYREHTVAGLDAIEQSASFGNPLFRLIAPAFAIANAQSGVQSSAVTAEMSARNLLGHAIFELHKKLDAIFEA